MVNASLYSLQQTVNGLLVNNLIDDWYIDNETRRVVCLIAESIPSPGTIPLSSAPHPTSY